MRISDWSSDVCSSDLSIIFRLPGNPTERRGRRASSYRVDRAIGGDQSLLARASFQRIAMFHTDDAVIAALAEPLDDRLIVDLARPRLEPPGIVPDLDVGNLVPATVERRDQEIGRASCRERVCQYV